jgi:hypothetical protein
MITKIEGPSDMPRLTNGLGWFAVALSLTISCVAAGSAVRKALFEDWWAPSVRENVGMIAGVLLLASIPAVFGLLAIGWPRVGGLVHVAAGCFVFLEMLLNGGAFLPNPNHPHIPNDLIIRLYTPLLLLIMGIAYIKGRPRPRWLALGLMAGLPIATALICSLEPIWRISHRQDDGVIAARRVQGNGVELIWAPAGPGWPKQGNAKLDEAEKTVSRLTDDGLSLADSPQNIWRLPTVDEVVRSLTQDGQNAGGEWNPELGQARYRVTPDKESPLWRVHSPVVSWWTSSRDPERPDGVSYIISYRGEVLKHRGFGSVDLGFRAVKERSHLSRSERQHSE